MKRSCTTTGLGLVNGPVAGVRIANPAYGPTAPPDRINGDRASWSRWDTPGRTLYIASTKETAFRECLAWTRMTGAHRNHLAKLAALFGETPEQTMRDITTRIAEWATEQIHDDGPDPLRFPGLQRQPLGALDAARRRKTGQRPHKDRSRHANKTKRPHHETRHQSLRNPNLMIPPKPTEALPEAPLGIGPAPSTGPPNTPQRPGPLKPCPLPRQPTEHDARAQNTPPMACGTPEPDSSSPPTVTRPPRITTMRTGE